ncbi:BACON domain-containing protein [Bacteroides sp. 224]|uniref:BACON domain-containing protein n=1 Tax=Bacteroides sp. 224 TaxID=2302936 RepID=UPI0013D4C1FA|nr:BACON domain-containing protein [Bacteroides sp. 224]NDV66943.1 hypothetical protein [Bacteroides sp. 224]
MKQLFNFLLVAMCVCYFSACSSDNDNPTKTIEINSGTETQIVYADDTESKEGISFTAAEPWTATVTEKATTKSRAPGASWLRLLFNGTEKYSGNAGTFTFVIELDANYTGTSRSATIVIESGKDSITITVTQEGVTEEGKEPDEPVQPVEPEGKLITKMVRTSSDQPGVIHTATILYDEENRIKKIDNVNYDGEGTWAIYNYEYMGYDGGLVKESKNIVNIHGRYKNSEKDGVRKEYIVLNAEGYAIDISRAWYDVDFEENIITDELFELTYKNGFLNKVSGYDETVGLGGIKSYKDNDYSICHWDENGNMVKVENVFYNEYSNKTSEATQYAQYSSYLNNFNLDINWMTEGLYIPGTSDSVAINIFGKKSKNLISQYKDIGLSNETITYQYTFDDELLTKVVATSNGGTVATYEFTYQ